MHRIFLTFDVEEFPRPEFSAEGCKKLVDLLGKHNVKATFFVTGYFAEKSPDTVKLLLENGHEVGCHGYKHVKLTRLKNKELKNTIAKATSILTKITNKKITGFRSPKCNVPQGLYNILAENGYKYDSSVHPAFVPGYYANFSKPLNPYKVNGILEIPLAVIPVIRFPISWWWMRNIGLWLTVLGTKLNIKKRDVILYFHPWEFVKLPKMKGVPFHVTRKTGDDFVRKLEKFILKFKNYRFAKLVDF